MSDDFRKIALPKTSPTRLPLSPIGTGLMRKPPQPAPSRISTIKDEFHSLKEVGMSVQRIRLIIQQELELARKTRADALRYQQETTTKARSEAHQLILHARLATQREIEELIREASAEIQKILADMRVIRITAQEELAAQKKFTDAAKICSMSLSMKETIDEGLKKIDKKKKKPVAAKS